MKSFFILGVTKRYSATCKHQTNEKFVQVVRFFCLRQTDNNGVTRDKPFGQSQQADLCNSGIPAGITYDQSSSRLFIKSKVA